MSSTIETASSTYTRIPLYYSVHSPPSTSSPSQPCCHFTMATVKIADVPFIYRFLFLYFEPAGALIGSLLLHFHPQPFLTTMAPTLKETPSHQVVYDMLAATYVLFAFNEAVILRLTDDLRIWKALLCGILLCDAIHLYGSWTALGSDMFWNPLNWRWEDAVNLGSLWGQGALRLAFIREVGFSTRPDAKSKRS